MQKALSLLHRYLLYAKIDEDFSDLDSPQKTASACQKSQFYLAIWWQEPRARQGGDKTI